MNSRSGSQRDPADAAADWADVWMPRLFGGPILLVVGLVRASRFLRHLARHGHRPWWLWSYEWPGGFVCAICQNRRYCCSCGRRVEKRQTVGTCAACVIRD